MRACADMEIYTLEDEFESDAGEDVGNVEESFEVAAGKEGGDVSPDFGGESARGTINIPKAGFLNKVLIRKAGKERRRGGKKSDVWGTGRSGKRWRRWSGLMNVC